MLNIFETYKNDNYYKFYIALQREIANSGYPQTPIFSVLNGDKERTTFNKFLN